MTVRMATLTGLLVLALCFNAGAGIFEVAVGVYGGASFPMEGDAGAGTVLGAKLRVLPPIPMVGAEAYYQRVGQEDADDVWNDEAACVDITKLKPVCRLGGQEWARLGEVFSQPRPDWRRPVG